MFQTNFLNTNIVCILGVKMGNGKAAVRQLSDVIPD